MEIVMVVGILSRMFVLTRDLILLFPHFMGLTVCLLVEVEEFGLVASLLLLQYLFYELSDPPWLLYLTLVP